MSFAMEPKTRGDEDKIASSIHRLTEEDPTIVFSRNVETKEMILSGMGQVHIEVNIEKMKRKFGVEVNLNTPKFPIKKPLREKPMFRANTRNNPADAVSSAIAGLILNLCRAAAVLCLKIKSSAALFPGNTARL